MFDTTFISNRSAHIAEEISREMRLTIANEVRRQKAHENAYADPARQQAKDKLQQIAYSELRSNKTLEGFLYGLERRGVGIESAKNKQGRIYGIRFSYEGHTFKASEIGREFGYHSIASNFSSSQERGFQVQYSHSQEAGNYQPSYSGNSGIASLLGDLLTPNHHHPTEDENNDLTRKKKKPKKRRYGRQI